MSFSTKDIEIGTKVEAGENKSLGLGNHTARVFGVSLNFMPFDKEQAQLVITFVGKPQNPEGFEGWPIDQDNPAKGNYPGPVVRAASSPFNFTHTDKNGNKIDRDKNIVRTLAYIAHELGVKNLVDEIDLPESATISDYVDAVSHVFRSSKTPLNILVGGRKYINKEGKERMNYYLPYVKGARTYQRADSDVNLVPVFNQAQHVYVPANLQNGNSNTTQYSNTASSGADDDLDW